MPNVNEEKSYLYQIYHCLKVKPSCHKKLFQKEKNRLLFFGFMPGNFQVICGLMLWWYGWRKSFVAGLNWNPCTRCLCQQFLSWHFQTQEFSKCGSRLGQQNAKRVFFIPATFLSTQFCPKMKFLTASVLWDFKQTKIWANWST